jgi:hypothetical protein
LLQFLDAAYLAIVPALLAGALLAPLFALTLFTPLLANLFLTSLVALALFPTLLTHLFLAPLLALALFLALLAHLFFAALFALALLLALFARAFLAALFALALLLPVVGLTAAFLHGGPLRLRLLCSLRLGVATLLLPLGAGDVLPALSLLALLLPLLPALLAAFLPFVRSYRLGHSQPAFHCRERRWGNQRTGQRRHRQQPNHMQFPILFGHVEITPSLNSRRNG